MLKLFRKAERTCPECSGEQSYSSDDLDRMIRQRSVDSRERGIQVLCDIDLDGGKKKSKKFRKHKYKGKSYKRSKRR